MRKQDGRTTVKELAILVANTDEGRQAFTTDPKAARAALSTRVIARRVAAKAAPAQEYLGG